MSAFFERYRVAYWLVTVIALGFAVYAFILIVNGLAFVSGVGPLRTVYIESVHTEYVPTTDAEGDSTVIEANVGVGYYLDDEGRRHPTEVVGSEIKPGDVIRTRLPLLPGPLMWAVRDRGQAVAEILLGLLAVPAVLLLFRLRRELT